jgi:hypothetical protein
MSVSPLDTTSVALVKSWLQGGPQLPAWQAAQVVTAGSAGAPGSQINDPAGHLQICIAPGTTGATIPTFNDAGGTTNDNGVVWQDGGISQDQNIQEAITAWGMYLLQFCGYGDQNNDIPAASPFNEPVQFTEVYDGNGSAVLYLRNRPIQSVESLVIGTLTIPQSTSFTTAGWVIRGDGKSIALRYGGGGAGVSNSQFYPNCGSRYNFWEGIQNVFIAYTAGFTTTPADLQFMSTRVVALSYKERTAIGQTSQAMAAGAGTVSFNWKISEKDWLTIVAYKRASA